MRGLVLLSVQTQTAEVDGALIGLLTADQRMRAAIYHLEQVTVRIGTQEDQFLLEERRMLVRTDPGGGVVDFNACKDATHQLATFLYGSLRGHEDTDFDLAVVTSGEPAANTAALQLGGMISTWMMRLAPIRLHMVLLQDQYVHNDRQTAQFLHNLEISNGWRPVYYASLNLLPWEDQGDTRERTRKTIATMLRMIVLAPGNPMLLPMMGQPGWLETVSVRRLDPPVERVTRIIYSYLTERFGRDVLSDMLSEDRLSAERAGELTAWVKKLEDFIQERERQVSLPGFDALLSIMPVRNPDRRVKPAAIQSPAQAWEVLRAVYGQAQADELYRQINPAPEEMVSRYQDMSRALTMQLLTAALEMRRASAGKAPTVPQLLEQLGGQLCAQVEKRRDPIMDDIVYDRTALNPKKRDALEMAKLRCHCLRLVYMSAHRSFGDTRRRLRREMAASAVGEAKRFLTACLTRLDSAFRHRLAVKLGQPVAGFSYDYRLEEAYRGWCEHNVTSYVTDRELYGLFTDDVLALSDAAAADRVCDGLMELFDARTRQIEAGIHVNIDSFFSELDFRARQLENLGMAGDLSQNLLDFLGRAQGQCPLLYQNTADHPFRLAARAMIFRRDGSRAAGAFSALVEKSAVPVISDPHEKGVLMVIKYAGDVLRRLLVSINNPAQGGGNKA